MNDFGGKNYGEYFKALEEQLNKVEADTCGNNAENEPRVNAKRRNGVYKTVRLRKSVIVAFAAVVVLAIGLAVKDFSKPAEAKPQPEVGKTQATEQKQENVSKISYSFGKDTPDILADNDAECAIIINKTDNKVVAARNAHKRVYPASTTKIMTVLVAAENITDMNDTFTMTYAITDPLFVAGASAAGFSNGEAVTMTDLLYGAVLPSGADATMGLAVKLAGSEEAFVKLMNQKVKELGLKNTNFTNVSGLHNKENYCSAYDMAVILDAAMQNEVCKKVLSTYQYTTAVTPQHPEGILLSSTLFNYMYGTEPETATILGGKTGFVNESGYCIASFGKANATENEYIVVTMGNSARKPAFYGQIELYKEFAK